MYTVESCGCIRDADGTIIPPRCGSRLVHNVQWAEALRESSRIRREMVAAALSFGGPQDDLAREAAAYGIVPAATGTDPYAPSSGGAEGRP